VPEEKLFYTIFSRGIQVITGNYIVKIICSYEKARFFL
jgi:hypothetical protein